MSAVFYRDLHAPYPTAVRGEGMYLYDSAGAAYLDMSGGAAVSSLGHGHPEVVAAVRDQVAELAFAHTAFFTNAPQEELAARLVARFAEPGARVYFTSGGSEANETALKLAWQYWQAVGRPDKTVIVSRRQSYHGNTLGALSVSGSRFRRAPFEGVLHDWPRIAPCYAYRHRADAETGADYAIRAASALERAVYETGAERIAAFIAEPVVGASLGAVPAEAGYFAEIRRICDRHEILLICDEVMCGSGRTGSFFAHEADGILPDIVTLAKGLGGGYQPLGAALARQHVWDAVRTAPAGFPHGHTYVGHATACAAGLAVQRCLDRDGLLARVQQTGARLFDTLRESLAEHPRVGDIRGRGLFAGIEIVEDRGRREPYPAEARLGSKLKKAAMAERLICYPGGGTADGTRGDHVLLAPPFIAEQTHLDELAEKLTRIFAQVLGS